MTSIGLSVISYNRKDDLRKALKSVFAQSRKPDEVLVVDNASVDGAPAMVEKEFPQARLLRLEKNLGLCGGANVAFEALHTDLVGIVESDTVLSGNWVEEVVRDFEARGHERVGIVCPKYIQRLPSGCVDVEIPPKENGSISHTNCIFAIHKKVFEGKKEKLYSEPYEMYAQEFDLSARVFNQGYWIKRNLAAATYHNVRNDAARAPSEWVFKNQFRNNLWSLWRFYSKRNILAFTLPFLVYFLFYVKSPWIWLCGLAEALAGLPWCMATRKVPASGEHAFYRSILANLSHIRAMRHYGYGSRPQEKYHYLDEKTLPEAAA